MNRNWGAFREHRHPAARLARRILPRGIVLTSLSLLAGCGGNVVLLDPQGPIGAQEKSLILTAAVLMLIVIVPVIVMAIAFAWRYRASNTKARYTS